MPLIINDIYPKKLFREDGKRLDGQVRQRSQVPVVGDILDVQLHTGRATSQIDHSTRTVIAEEIGADPRA